MRKKRTGPGSPASQGNALTAPARWLAYLRVSTDEQAQSGTSLETQRERLTAAALAAGGSVAEYFVDEGCSGADPNRPALLRLLEAVKAGQGDVVAVTAVDRLARDPRLLLNTLHDLKNAGVAFLSLRESWDTSTPAGRAAVQMSGVVAGLEREFISERTREGRRHRLAAGLWPGGRVPYGYRRGADGGLEIVPDEAQVVHDLHTLADTKRLGVRSLQVELESRGVLAPDGGKLWGTNSIHKLLTNPVYMGRHVTGVLAPPIVEPELWERVQARLKANRRLKTGAAVQRPLQSRVRCAVCGGNYHIVPGSKGPKRYGCRNRYAWSGRYRRTGERCDSPLLDADDLEARVGLGLYDVLRDKKSLARTLETTHQQMVADSAVVEKGAAPVEAAMKDLDRELMEIERSRIKGRLPPDELDQMERDALKRRSELKGRFDALGGDTLRRLQWQRAVLDNGRPLFAWAGRYMKEVPLKDMGNLRSFRDTSDPPVPADTARKIALAPVAWLTDPKLARGKGPSFHVILTQALDRLHAEVFVHQDRVAVRGLVPFEVPEASTYASRLGRGLR